MKREIKQVVLTKTELERWLEIFKRYPLEGPTGLQAAYPKEVAEMVDLGFFTHISKGGVTTFRLSSKGEFFQGALEGALELSLLKDGELTTLAVEQEPERS